MKQILTILLTVFIAIQTLEATVLISVEDAMQSSLGIKDLKIEKKNILLNKDDLNKIQKFAKVKIASRIIKSYIIKEKEKTIAYGVLISRKIRSKNGVVLYLFDPSATLLSMEMIAFNEPLEYLPSGSWEKQFENISPANQLELGRNVTPITGATLSAQSIVEASRIAQTVCIEFLKGL